MNIAEDRSCRCSSRYLIKKLRTLQLLLMSLLHILCGDEDYPYTCKIGLIYIYTYISPKNVIGLKTLPIEVRLVYLKVGSPGCLTLFHPGIH